MSFLRVRDGRYVYKETRQRRGSKVQSISEYLGVVGVDRKRARTLASAEKAAAKIDAYQRATFGETGAERAAREAKSTFSQSAFVAETAAPTPSPSTPGNASTESSPEAGKGSGEGET